MTLRLLWFVFSGHNFPNLIRLSVTSPADVVLLDRAGVCFLGTGTGGAADVCVVGVNAEPGLKHHQAVIILVTAPRVWEDT